MKLDGNGEIQRYKARLCAKGFSQTHGIDYNEAYAPTTRHDTIRFLFTTAVRKDLKIAQFYVKIAFLHGELEEDVYMQPPDGFNVKSGIVYQLKRSLYGLKQSSRCWNQKCNRFLQKFGLTQCESDKCVYKGLFENEIVLLIIYDDGLILAESEDILKRIISEMQREFQITSCQPAYLLAWKSRGLKNQFPLIEKDTYRECTKDLILKMTLRIPHKRTHNLF